MTARARFAAVAAIASTLAGIGGCREAQTPPAAAATGVSQAPVSASANARPREINFDDVKFPLAVGAPFDRKLLTPAIEQLDGQRVRIRGYILPSFQQTGITQFVLVRDNMECCFGPGAALYDCIVVEMQPGKTADYTVRPVSVLGTFAIKEWRDEFTGKHLAIYHIDGEEVE